MCPAVWVSACGVMADVPLLFFQLLAVLLAVRGVERSRPADLWASGMAAAAAAMTKAFGASLSPLLYWLGKSGRWSHHALGLFLSVAALGAWGATQSCRPACFIRFPPPP